MNAYPPELLNHHFACMLVAGLVPSTTTTSTGPGTASASASKKPDANQTGPSSERTAGGAAEGGPSAPSDPSTPPSHAPAPAADASASPSQGHVTSSLPTEAFPELCKNLAEIFGARGRNTVWDPARGRSAVFHSVLVDHNARLPPHKTRLNPRTMPTAAAPAAAAPADSSGTSSAAAAAAPTSTGAATAAANGASTSPSNATKPLPSVSDAAAALANMPPRSPLSPLHPSSPLFPDGLIAPIWARKHRELIPSVFVAFHCLAEKPGGPEAPQTAESGEALRRRDEDLIRHIGERRRALAERGIKMTVVLLTHRSMLDDPALEARLSYVRRTSGLDSKASLFVLTPVSKHELGEFVTSLHRALHESALDYYREHARRVKRKRARYPPPPAVVQPILSAAATLQQTRATTQAHQLAPLSREGWIVRAEYKLAAFAELQGDNDEALLRYHEAYAILAGPCLGSTMMLPPRTKRWAEAKVLADTLSIKIAKLHLYNDDATAAVRQLRRHLHRFTELSTGWGIGSTTFEYWSWLCKQYRLFADLMDAATRAPASPPFAPLSLPVHAPPLPARLLHPYLLAQIQAAGVASPPGMLTPNQAAILAGVSPASVVQGSGTFYYLAALCTIERRDRFSKLIAAERLGPDEVAQHPTLSHEQKVDYTAHITEQLTRAYDCFKRAKQQRLSLMVASKIALTYLEGGQHEMALRFLERILRSYRRDGCHAIQSWLTLLAAGCAVHIDDVESAIRSLVEVLSLRLDASDEERSVAADHLASIFEGYGMPLPEGKAPVRIESDATGGLLYLESVFLDESVEVGAPAAFQLRLTAPRGSQIVRLVFESLEISIAGFERPLVVERNPDSTATGTEIVDVGQITHAALAQAAEASGRDQRPLCGLVWSAGSTKAFQGTIVADAPGPLEITAVTLRTAGAVPVELVFDLSTPPGSVVARVGEIRDPRWLVRTPKGRYRFLGVLQRERSHLVRVRPRTYKLDVVATHSGSAYLDENFPIVVSITNREDEALECRADLALQATYEGNDDTLRCGDAAPAPQIRNHACGIVGPGETIEVPFFLKAARRGGERTVDFVVHSWAKGGVDGGAPTPTMTNEAGAAAAQAEAPQPEGTRSSETTLSIHVPIWGAIGPGFLERWENQTAADAPRAANRLLDFDDDNDVAGSDREGGDDGEDDGAVPAYDSAAIASLWTPRTRRSVVLETTLQMVGPAPIVVHSIDLVLPSGAKAPRLAKGFDAQAEHEDLLGLWWPGDGFVVSYPLSVVAAPAAPAPAPAGVAGAAGSTGDSSQPPGRLVISWSRAAPALHGAGPDASRNQTTFRLPTLVAPAASSLTVLTHYPQIARLDAAFDFALTLRNTSASSRAVFIMFESSEAFVFAGPRRLAVPHLLAGEERKVEAWRLVPLRTGRVGLPRITVICREREGGEEKTVFRTAAGVPAEGGEGWKEGERMLVDVVP
ncbi:hypothetical protein ACQY0O_002480 [Thecaphora frezii]